ncbi:hypothetical protein AB0D11_47520 [Streptomyces monashensis]|uniref:hypothetical protein n=1 Tax=Streptomyces monashensis TaxID=1678012 RepID=UPI0033FA0B4A
MDSYRLPSDENERTQLTWRIAADGYLFLEAAFASAAPDWLREVPAVGILRTVWLPVSADGHGQGAGGGLAGKNDLPHKVHFTATCDAQESGRPHLITHVVTTDATDGGPVVVDEIHDRLHAKHLPPGEHLMDAGYISAELLLTAPAPPATADNSPSAHKIKMPSSNASEPVRKPRSGRPSTRTFRRGGHISERNALALSRHRHAKPRCR